MGHVWKRFSSRDLYRVQGDENLTSLGLRLSEEARERLREPSLLHAVHWSLLAPSEVDRRTKPTLKQLVDDRHRVLDEALCGDRESLYSGE